MIDTRPRKTAKSELQVAETKRRFTRHLILGFTRGFRRYFWLALLMLILEAITAVFEPYPITYLIDFLTGKRAALSLTLPGLSPRASTVALATLALVLLAAVNSACDSIAEIFLARGGRTLGLKIRVALFSHLQKLSLAFHNQRRTGDVLTRVTGDVQAIEEFVVRSLSDVAGSILLVIGTLAFLFSQSWQVALMAVVLVPLLSVVSNYFSSRIKATAKQQRAREGDLASEAQEMLTSIRVIQTYGQGGRQEKFAEASGEAMRASLRTASLEARFSFVMSVMQALIISAVVWLALLLIDRNLLTVGTLVLFVILIQNMFKPMRRIVKEVATIGKTYASIDRIGELLSRQPSVTDAPGAIPATRLRGDIELRDVSFAYQLDPEDVSADGDKPPVRLALQGISFRVAPGDVVALVGPSGAGKSTIAQLIPRLYDPHHGQVLIDGRDIREYTLDSLRSQISMVLQDTILFSGSVAYNIAYGREDASNDDIEQAARQANAHDFISSMPEGYLTDLSERAANLSGGQRQRIAIARALVRNAPILMLDEPTTGLDAESSAVVLEALHRLMKGKSTIIISHDLNLIRSADRIVVIKDGQIEEVGTHEQLMERGGLYASLHAKQFGEPVESAVVAQEPADEAAEGSVFRTLLMKALPVPANSEILEVSLHRTSEPAADGPAPASVGDVLPPRAVAAESGQPANPVDEGLQRAPGETSHVTPRHRAPAVFETKSMPVIGPDAPGLPGTPPWPDRGESALDARTSEEVLRRLPAMATAFDTVAMRERLAEAIVGEGYVVDECRVGQTLYLGGDECALRYHVRLLHAGTGRVVPRLLTARLFVDGAHCAAYVRDRLTPLADRVRQRAEVRPFIRPAAAIAELSMSLHAFPIDPELPQLVEATDPERMARFLEQSWTVSGRRHPAGATWRVELAHYPRRFRCVLRYVLSEPTDEGVSGAPVYGKVYADGQPHVRSDIVDALREALAANPRGIPIRIPEFVGSVWDLREVLMDGIPGFPLIARLVVESFRGGGNARDQAVTLEQAITAGAMTAAALHNSGLSGGVPRTIGDEVAQLRSDLDTVNRISPELGERLDQALSQVVRAARSTVQQDPSFSHGDFTHSQLLFDGRDVGMVDLDNLCQAEPALDLGQFLAYLRVAIRKASHAASLRHEALSEQLRERFLHAYQDAARVPDLPRFSERVELYERVSLVRMVVRSWQQLKPARTANALSVLEERTE